MRTQEYASEIDAIRDLRQRGFAADLEFRDGSLRETSTGRRLRPEELAIVEHHRFEGASDPQDMAVVYALESDDGVRGLVVDAFGVYADPGLAAFLEKVKVREVPAGGQ
jgi:hypothetical protein